MLKCGNDASYLWKGMHLMRMESKKAASVGHDATVEDVNTGRRKTSCPLESCCTLWCIGHIPRVNYPIWEGMHPLYGLRLGGVHAVCKHEIKTDNTCECVLFATERIKSDTTYRRSTTYSRFYANFDRSSYSTSASLPAKSPCKTQTLALYLFVSSPCNSALYPIMLPLTKSTFPPT